MRATNLSGLGRYNELDQDRRDAGDGPDFLVDPYWTFFGSEYTVDEIEVVKRLRLVDEDANEVRVE